MKRSTRILGAVAILVVAGLLLIPLLVNPGKLRPALEKQLTAALGRSVELGDLNLSVFSRSLVAGDIRIADDPAFSSSAFLTAKELRIGVALTPLILSHKVKLQSLEIESPRINLIRASDTLWNFSNIGRAAAAANDGEPTSLLPSLPVSSVGRLGVKDGRVVIRTLKARGEPRVYEHVNFAARDFSLAAQFAFDLSANLGPGDTINITGRLGPINRNDVVASPGDVHVVVKNLNPVATAFLSPNAGVSFLADLELDSRSDGETLTNNGTIHLQRLKLRKGGRAAPGPVELSYTGTHRLRDNAGEIRDAAIKVSDTEIHVHGTYKIVGESAKGAVLDLKIDGRKLPCDDFQVLMTAAAVRLPNGSLLKGGTVSMDLSVAGQAESLVIAGPITVDNTRLVGFDIGSKFHGIAALSGVQTGDTADFESLRMNVRVTNSGTEVDKIESVIAAIGSVSGRGTISLNGQLDFNLVVIGLKARGIGKAGAGALSMLAGQRGTSVPVRVTGTSEDLSITADVGSIVRKKASALANSKK